ncbi:MAG: hypothetical protein ACM31L_19445 [Actinomycetota bacterium]
MAGDVNTDEFLLPRAVAATGATVPVLHDYGRRVRIGLGTPTPAMRAMSGFAMEPGEPTLSERLGEQAFSLRQSGDFRKAKAARAHGGRSWGEADGGPEPLVPVTGLSAPSGGIMGSPPPPSLSDRLAGRIAVGVIIVSGPTPALTVTDEEQVKIAAEVQNGLTWLASKSPARDVTWAQHFDALTVDVPDRSSAPHREAYEAPWRDAALAQLGMPLGMDGARAYARKLMADLGADRGFCAFFTKYTLWHFAYANMGGPRLVMQYGNDGWGPDNIDRVFAHETCHIFGAPDEYRASNCDCGGAYGPEGLPNGNCETCAPDGGQPCIMRANDWTMCEYTFRHLGYTI